LLLHSSCYWNKISFRQALQLPSDLHSRGSRFECRLWPRLSSLILFVVFLSLSGEMS
jgi:hypothetical protein